MRRREARPQLADFGAEGPQAGTSAPTGARTMTGQEVPRDGLPAPQVSRPASLGILEVFSSRWVSNIAPDEGREQKRFAGCQWACGPEPRGAEHSQAGQGQLSEARTREPEATMHESAGSPVNFAPNVLF